ncbi:MAG TPA: Lon-insertion domain-containing protein, partial [Planctomycetota bacterium]|nr:Lon-insertion domain-containing protein [Planctomycetota bacterium]
GDPSAPARTGIIKPEPIPTRVKVVLVGDYHLYDYLFENDPDFQEIFKIRSDFQLETDLTPRLLKSDFPGFVAEICRDEGLAPVNAAGLARLAEYGVRQAGRRGKITAQSTILADVLREAHFWSAQSRKRTISADEIDRAIREAIDRVNLLERKIAEMIADGTILISLTGSRVGQVNGLAIYDMGDYAFGKPSRITCETSVGQGGILNIERESGFSGRSHDKGVQILGGYLRACFAQERPLSLTASICFEQSYSGIDGDSASATEMYAILSSLSNLPIRQDIAVTGSVNQKGDMQPIGGVNEKIEGFFDCVRAARPTGQEGVIIPRANVDDLMLRRDVVAAVEKGTFHIYAIDTVSEGIEILTGIPAGKRRKDGSYPPGCVYSRVEARLEELANHLRRFEVSSEEG